MRVRRTVPEHLTLVSHSLPSSGEFQMKTLVVDDEEGYLILTATGGGTRIQLQFTETQAKQLVARINKYFRENK